MKEIIFDGQTWLVDTEKAKKLGLLVEKKETAKYHIGQRFVHYKSDLTKEEYILAEVAFPNTVGFISLETGRRYNWIETFVENMFNITQEEMDELLDGDDAMKLKMKTFDVTLIGYDEDDVSTHDELMWINAKTYEEVVAFVERNGIPYQSITEIRYVPTMEDGVDVILQ